MVAAAPSGSAVRCRGLTKTFGSGPAAVQALRGVDLDLELGEVLMVVGPSGSGKTTLRRRVCGPSPLSLPMPCARDSFPGTLSREAQSYVAGPIRPRLFC